MEKLSIQNLSFFYNDKTVIKNFNLSLNKGDICGLMGSSGSGKTTLLRLIAGLETPDEGTISMENQVIYNDKIFVPPQKRGIGFVFQDYGLFPHLTVEKNITYGLHKKPKEERLYILQEMLELIGMCDYRKRYPYQLSGGQQQRVALARALAPGPGLLLLDEPFSNLDKETKHKIRHQVRGILKSTKTTCILSTHDIKDIEVVCTTGVKIDSRTA